MDFQQSILGFMADPAPLLSNTSRVINSVREAGGRIGYVRVAFSPEEVEKFPPHSAMGGRVRTAGSKMSVDSAMTAIHQGVAPKSSDIVVRKTRVGAFSTTDLDLQLRNGGIDTLVLTGVHTSGVVLTTVREAHDLDYRVIVLSDACADPDSEIHQFLFTRIFPKQATVCSAAALEGALAPWLKRDASSPKTHWIST